MGDVFRDNANGPYGVIDFIIAYLASAVAEYNFRDFQVSFMNVNFKDTIRFNFYQMTTDLPIGQLTGSLNALMKHQRI